jgi:peptidoglycan/LPS O-acetylase OafA/YrhL
MGKNETNVSVEYRVKRLVPEVQLADGMVAAESVLPTTPSTRDYGVSTGEDSKLRNLDLLRAFAVLAVLSAHMMPVVTIGTLQQRAQFEHSIGNFGVLIFFVHTALVLMLSMERSAGSPGWVRRFYVQRVFRIYPLSVICVAAVLAFQLPPDMRTPFAWPSPSNLLANLALLQNLHGFSLASAMWSLPFEIQMYLLLPGLFWLVRKEGRGAASILALAAVMVAIAEKALFHGPWISQFFPCFMGGVVAFATFRRRPILPAYAWPVAITALAVGLYCWGLSLWLQWGVCIALGAMIPLFREIPLGAVSRGASLVARYSYGIYLAHLPLRWLCFERLHLPEWGRWLLFLILVAAVPMALYHAVESPMIRFGKRLSNATHRPAPSLAIAELT